jgi:hypothetical protein
MAAFLMVAGFGGWIHSSMSDRSDPLSITPFGMLVFIYLIMIYGFNSESNSCKSFLLELLEGDYE